MKYKQKGSRFLSLDGELGGGDVIDFGVRVVGSALSLADSHLSNVVTRWPLLTALWLWLSLDLEVNVVDVWLKSSEDVSSSNDVTSRVLDGKDHLSAASGVGDAQSSVEVNRGVSVSRVRVGSEAGEVGSTVIGGVANGHQLASIEWVQVNLTENLDEHVNSNNVAQQGANFTQGWVWQQSAESTAASDNTSVGNNLNKVVDGLGHKGDASWAEVKANFWSGELDLQLWGDSEPQGREGVVGISCDVRRGSKGTRNKKQLVSTHIKKKKKKRKKRKKRKRSYCQDEREEKKEGREKEATFPSSAYLGGAG